MTSAVRVCQPVRGPVIKGNVIVKFKNIESQSVAKERKPLKGGVSHRAMVAALAMPLMLLISPTSRSGRISLPIGGSARAATTPLDGGAVTFTAAKTGSLTAVGIGTRFNITGTITTGQSAVIKNSGSIVRTGTGSVGPAIFATTKFEGTISNRDPGVIAVSATGSAPGTAQGIVVAKAANGTVAVNNITSGQINVTANVTGAGNSARATGVAIFATTANARVKFFNDGEGDLTVKATAAGTGSLVAIARGVVIGATAPSAAISGTITNNGTINVSANATKATNAGTRTNIAFGISISANVATFTGNIRNNGPITAALEGTFASAGGVHVANKLAGNFSNAAAGVINVTAAGSSISATGFRAGTMAGAIINSGFIKVSVNGTNIGARGIRVANTLVGDFINTGTIKVTAAGSSIGATGFRAGAMTGNIFNFGSIAVKVTGTNTNFAARGVRVDNTLSGIFANTTGASIRVTASGSSFGATGFRAGAVTNTIRNENLITVSANGTNFGARGIRVDGKHGGVFVNDSQTGLGMIKVNAEGISFAATGVRLGAMTGNAFNNLGKITVSANGTSFGARGIRVTNALSADLNNTGIIKVVAIGSSFGATGVRLGAMNGTLFNDGGLITVSALGTDFVARGIRVTNALSGNLTNAGTIKVVVNEANSVSATGVRLGSMEGNILNLGSIIVSATGVNVAVRGIRIDNTLVGTFINTAAGVISVAATATAGIAVAEGFVANGVSGGL